MTPLGMTPWGAVFLASVLCLTVAAKLVRHDDGTTARRRRQR